MRGHRFNRPLTVAFEADVYGKIKAISDDLNISMAEWIRQACNAAICEIVGSKKGVVAQRKD